MFSHLVNKELDRRMRILEKAIAQRYMFGFRLKDSTFREPRRE
jgi:hypothetical protein